MNKNTGNSSNILPIIVVTGVLIFKDKKKVLLCKKPDGVGPYPGCWLTPGGGIENNESLNECAKREVYEEVGVKITNLKKSYVTDFITKNWKGNKVQFIAVLFTAEYDSGTLGSTENDDDRMKEIKWFKIEQAN